MEPKLLSDEQIRAIRNSHNDTFYTQREFNADKSIAKVQAKLSYEQGKDDMRQQIVEWGGEPCPHRAHNATYFRPRHACEKCWQALREGRLEASHEH